MGRPILDIAEKLRRRIWYHNVRLKSGLSDYQLSINFDLKFASSSNRSGGKLRRRLFETLRKSDVMPFRGHTDQFVNGVDQYSDELRGTAKIFFSPFWTLVSPQKLNKSNLRNLILESARASCLLEKEGNISAQREVIEKLNQQSTSRSSRIQFLRNNGSHYERSLSKVLSDVNVDLNILGLLGGLYLECNIAGDIDVLIELRNKLDKLVMQIAQSDLIPENSKDEFVALVNTRILEVPYEPFYEAKSYISAFSENENINSPLGQLLQRHDRLLWNIIDQTDAMDIELWKILKSSS